MGAWGVWGLVFGARLNLGAEYLCPKKVNLLDYNGFI